MIGRKRTPIEDLVSGELLEGGSGETQEEPRGFEWLSSPPPPLITLYRPSTHTTLRRTQEGDVCIPLWALPLVIAKVVAERLVGRLC